MGLVDQHETCKIGGVTLPEFIESIGEDAAARLFEVPVRTVLSWKYLDRRPRRAMAKRIAQCTKGRVSIAEIYTAEREAA